MPHIPRVLCGQCKREMERARCGVIVEMMTVFGERGSAPSGYYKVMADLFACDCGNTVIAGFAQEPLAEHYEPAYGDQRIDLQARFR